jgi:hypothetical protein
LIRSVFSCFVFSWQDADGLRKFIEHVRSQKHTNAKNHNGFEVEYGVRLILTKHTLVCCSWETRCEETTICCVICFLAPISVVW